MKLFEINEKFEIEMRKKDDLEKEYEGKIKGDAYKTRYAQIVGNLQDLKNKAMKYGAEGSICHVHGVRHRPNRKNNQVMIKESFNLYFSNVSENEVPFLVKLHVKNVLQYTISFIRPGIVMTS